MSNIFTDEQITAYLDGEKEHTPYEAINAARKTDTQLDARIKALSFDLSKIQNSMDGLLKVAPKPPELPKPIAANDNGSSLLKNGLIAACVASFILFSGIIGYSISDRQTDSWREYVAAYHYLYITNTLSAVENKKPAAIAELERVGKAIGKKLQFASLIGFEGLDYKRSQILGYEGKPLAQMTFLSKMGTPIALCVIRSGLDADEAINNVTLEGMAAAKWSKNGYEYIIIGGNDQILIDNAAQHFVSKI